LNVFLKNIALILSVRKKTSFYIVSNQKTSSSWLAKVFENNEFISVNDKHFKASQTKKLAFYVKR